MQYNNELQKIDTEQKAYFLGLLYADGCITEKAPYQLHTRLSLTDEELILKLRVLFPFFNSETWDFGMYNENSKIQYGMRKTSKELYKDLLSNGILPRKSTENKDLVVFPSISEELVRHFIRGYFDGDGSISIAASRPNLRRAEICSVSKSFLLELQQIFIKNSIKTKIRSKLPGIRGKTILYVIEWMESDTILQLKEFLYKDATIFLGRKKDLFDSFRKIHRKEKNPDCPMCLTKGNTKKMGIREMNYGTAYRYKCDFCNKGFTLSKVHDKSEELLENQEIDNQQPS